MKLSTTLCLMLCLSSSLAVRADESYGDLSARIGDLEKKMGGQSASGEDFATQEDLEPLKNQIKELRGRLEVLEHQASKNSTMIGTISTVSAAPDSAEDAGAGVESAGDNDAEDDVEAILKDLSTSPTSTKETARDKATEKAEKEAPTGILEKSDDSAQYNQAMALYKNKEYGEAEEAFRYYVKQYPKGKQVSQAKLHIANCELALATETKQKDTAKMAAADFAAAYKANSKGSLGAQALVGMAQAINLQGETKKACVVLKKLQADFPKEKSTMSKAKDLFKQYKCR
ncbi:MAG: tetratricopeptide repeat protein [Candidatus Paracaedibacteraceae bacterium]|nr:tetratricopeptide repeat protein [Candidatus Paracaedibacteraceae bacterium]